MLLCGQQYDDTVGNPLAVVDRALHGAWSARQGLFLLSIFLKSLALSLDSALLGGLYRKGRESDEGNAQ
jgi:hypothetical protein